MRAPPPPPQPPPPSTSTTPPPPPPPQQLDTLPVIAADPLRTPVALQRYYPHQQRSNTNPHTHIPTHTQPTTTTTAPTPRSSSSSNVLKVNQVDAHVLDTELLDLLRIQLGSMLAPPFFPPGFMDRYKPELNALLDFILFRFTIFRNEPTPGMRMQNLRFVDGRAAVGGGGGGNGASLPAPRVSQRLLLGLLYIGGKWAFARLRRYALVAGWADEDQFQQQQQQQQQQQEEAAGAAGGSQGSLTNAHTSTSTPTPTSNPTDQWKRHAYKSLDRAESLFRLAWLINFLVFLKYGQYPSLLQRLTGMRLVYKDTLGGLSRTINFQFMNRQLLWEHFTQLALCVVPLVDWDGLRRQVSGLIRQRRLGATADDGGGGVPGAGGADGDMMCVICSEEAQTPYVTECGHVYCYYCLKTACLQDDSFACPRCGSFFATSKRWVVG